VAQTVFIVCVRQILGDFKTNLADFFAVQTPGGADGFYCLCTKIFWGFLKLIWRIFIVQTPGGADGFYCLWTTKFWGF
jgi:hypothetical protein